MGLYIDAQAVQLRLVGKVAFTTSLTDENSMPLALLNRLINESEGQVELQLSPRYAAPFQTDSGQPFGQLPLRPTMEYLRTLCELMSVMRVLQTDFGRGSAVNGDSYYNSQKKQFDEMVEFLLKKDASGKFIYPPLTGLMLNYMNREADDGFAGMVLNSSDEGHATSFPLRRINDPSETFWSITPRDIRE